MIPQGFQKIFLYFIIGLFFVLGMYWRYDFTDRNPLNRDERLVVHNLHRVGFPPIINCRNYGDSSCFVGMYVLNFPLVHHFPEELWLIRLPHILITIITFFALLLYCRKRFKTMTAVIISLMVFAFNDTFIRHGFELRPYPILPLMTLFYLWFWEFFISKDQLSINKKIGWVVLFIILGGFHPYSLFMFGLPLVFFGVSRFVEFRKRIYKQPIFFLSLIFSTIGIWLFYYLQSKAEYLNTMDPGSYTYHYFGHPIEEPVRFAKNIVGNLLGHKLFYLLLPLSVVGIVMASVQEKVRQILFVVILIGGGLFCVFVPSYLTGYTFIQRQFIWVMIYGMIFLGATIDHLLVFVKEKLRLR